MNDRTTESIGSILTDQGNDAVHIAVAVAEAGEFIERGSHIEIVEGKAVPWGCRIDEQTVGIVDPFIGCAVKPGERFYVFLYPGSITSLRHEWTHPAFVTPTIMRPTITMDEATFMAEYAAIFQRTPEEMMDVARQHIATDGDWNSDNTLPFDTPDEAYSGTVGHTEFWRIFTKLTGIEPKEEVRNSTMFSCSC